MATIDLDEQELDLVTKTLEYDQGRLILEITHTDTREYKDYLKEKAAVLERVLRKLKGLR